MALPATLLFAIRMVTERQPSLDAAGVCAALRAKNWAIDDDEVIAHLERPAAAARAKASREEELPSLTAALREREIEVGALPPDLAGAVDAFMGRLAPKVPSPRKDSSSVWVTTVHEIIDGLTAELATAADRSPERRVRLRAGALLGTSTGGYAVRWEMDNDAPTSDGASVQVAFERGPATAEVLHIHGTSITLYVEGKLDGKAVPDADLVLDASFLLDLRRRHLRAIEAGERQLDEVAALGFLAPAASPKPVQWNGNPSLNLEQASFVLRALGGGTTWLWGPPGTGKTTTLAVLLGELLSRGQRVLFVSNTNAAVDVALVKFLDTTPPPEVGDVVRLGPSADSALATHPHGPVSVDGIAAARGMTAAGHLAECRQQIKQLTQDHARLAAIAKDPVAARDRGFFGDPDDDLFDLRRRLDEEGVEAERDQKLAAKALAVERRRGLEAVVDLVESEIVSHGRLVFATVHQTYLRRLASERFDVVVIDEASMVSSDLVTLAAGRGCGWTVIAGDFRQLGPIAQSEAALTRKWLRASPFDRAGVSARVARRDIPDNLVALTTQHRMRPRIQSIISDVFYPEIGLKTATLVSRRSDRLPTNISDELVLVDTSSLGPWMGKRNGRYSRLNVLHAQVVDAIAGRVAPGASFGAVSPFAPQARLLQSLIETRDRHAASTVHRFQGGERSVMAWDMTEGRAGGRKLNPWFAAVTPDQEGARLMNVALSRAQDQLFVVADLDRARAGCADTTLVRRTLHRVAERGRTVDAVDFLGEPSTGRTSLHTAAVLHPLLAALDEPGDWLVVWCSEPPRALTLDVVDRIRAHTLSGKEIYVRTGVPGNQGQYDVLHHLQILGCHVQLVRPCWENLIITGASVTASRGNLVNPGATQQWLRTVSEPFAETVLRTIRRRGDADPYQGQPDALCPQGHPLLVEYAPEQDYRGRCVQCPRNVTALARTGRSLSRAASVRQATCRSCGREFDLSGWCGC